MLKPVLSSGGQDARRVRPMLDGCAKPSLHVAPLTAWWSPSWIGSRSLTDASDLVELANDSSLRCHTGKRLTAALSRPEKTELDGDAFGGATALNAWMKPGAFTVRVPTSG